MRHIRARAPWMLGATRATTTTTTTTAGARTSFARVARRVATTTTAARAPAPRAASGDTAASHQRAASMPGEFDDAKRAMRRAMRDSLRAMSAETISIEDAAIARHARQVRRVRDAARCATYLASARLREASTSALIADALTRPASMVFAPVVDVGGDAVRVMRMVHVEDVTRDVERGAYDLPEPTASYADGRRRLDVVRDVARVGALDVIIVPGVAFNARGVRLGRGGGYYDSFLSLYAETVAARGLAPPLVVALAYSCQYIADADVPAEAHDRCVDVVITPSGSIACTPAGALALESSV